MLPRAWTIDWAEGEKSLAPGELSLRVQDQPKVASVSRAFWRDGLAALAGAGRDFPLGAVTIRLARFPALDELWCLFMIAAAEAAGPRERPARWEAMVRYAEHVRLGYLLDKVAPEQAILPLYQAIVDQHLGGDAPAREAFVEDALALCARIDERLASGEDLLASAHFTGDPRFSRYLAMLAADQALYREDARRGRAFSAEMPARNGQGARRAALLALDRPAASQFKVWARRDERAPGGEGYALLLVRAHESLVLSADPLRRIKLDFLAAGLSALEKERGGEPWYDGARHEGTLVASARAGSKLTLEEVVAHLRGPLSLAPVKPAKAAGDSRVPWVAGSVLAAIAVVAAVAVKPGSTGTATSTTTVTSTSTATVTSTPTDEARVRSGAKGEPLPPAQLKEVAAADGERPKYALVAGACSYSGEHELQSPCRDARAVRKLLTERYGYSAANVIYLVDRDEPGEKTDGKATARNMKRQVERFRERFGDHEESSFLFYYSGHGGYIAGAHADYGVLQPTGFFDKYAAEPYSNRGWDMQSLMDDIKKGVPSKHLMLVVDACYSGWAGAKGDGELDDKVRALWNERAEVILSAASKGQRAWEDEHDARAWSWDGHSVLTAFLLRGLEPGERGKANADGNGDGIVTDEELAGYLRKAVPDSVAQNKGDAKQTPQFFRLDERLSKSGQFLFVPKP